MEIFIQNKINIEIFDESIRRLTRDFGDTLALAVKTKSTKIETTHLLISLSKFSDSIVNKGITRLGITSKQWESGLLKCAIKGSGLPPAHLTKNTLHISVINMLNEAIQLCNQYKLQRISEPVLVISILKNLTNSTQRLFHQTDIDFKDWCKEIERTFKPVEALIVYKSDNKQSINLDILASSAKKVLRLATTEAESMGFSSLEARHLLLGLIENEGGITQYGIYQQGLMPRKIQEGTLLSIRNKVKRKHSKISLIKENVQGMLQRIFELAGKLAGRENAEKIFEKHILLAFLTIDSIARKIMEDEKVDISRLKTTAEEHDIAEEDDDNDDNFADIETVRERLYARIVGQDQAIERILPHVQRMQFGYSSPERPNGVFLFCGQSGSGKTEMAKELARAVYGSEENLIFLEMGQFNSPESMNIFVGAPPGYVGYGEGKLTNGLRNKPRSVVLFDEVEKAHARVHDALLRFLDEGKIDDPAGPVRSGSECILILTSNVGAEELAKFSREKDQSKNIEFEIRQKLRDEFKKRHFRIEFLNRIDELILFRTLDKNNYTEIAKRIIENEILRLKENHEITAHVGPTVQKAIGDYCNKIDEGARAVKRLVQSVVITPVINYVIAEKCQLPIELKVNIKSQHTNIAQAMQAEPVGVVSK